MPKKLQLKSQCGVIQCKHLCDVFQVPFPGFMRNYTTSSFGAARVRVHVGAKERLHKQQPMNSLQTTTVQVREEDD